MAKIIRAIADLESKAIFVTSSSESQRLAHDLGLNLSSLETHQTLDIMIDGADEVDPNFDMIKGRGGAHTREKIVSGAAKQVLIVIDKTKLVKNLGEHAPVPVEVLPFAPKYTVAKIWELGGNPTIRMGASGTPFVTDNGNYLVDVKFETISDATKLEQKINSLPGVIDNGIFADVADVLLVGYEGGCKTLRSKISCTKFL